MPFNRRSVYSPVSSVCTSPNRMRNFQPFSSSFISRNCCLCLFIVLYVNNCMLSPTSEAFFQMSALEVIFWAHGQSEGKFQRRKGVDCSNTFEHPIYPTTDCRGTPHVCAHAFNLIKVRFLHNRNNC